MDPLTQLREICLARPDSTERLSHGEPTWFYKGKRVFVTYANHHHGARLSFWCVAGEGVQEAVVGSEPERFFRPPYVGGKGWLGVYLDVEIDWNEIEGLVQAAYDIVAKSRALTIGQRSTNKAN